MTNSSNPRFVDHFLVARVEASITGANAHDLHSLLAIYHGLCRLSSSEESVGVRIVEIEAKLRRFCQSGQLQSAV